MLLDFLKNDDSRGAFIMQQDLQDYEQRIADYYCVQYAVGVTNVTDGLKMGLRAAWC